MLLHEITDFLEQRAPLPLQENYDNSGLIAGTKTQEIKSLLICLDCTEGVMEEAIRLGCNLVVAHHPIVFSGLKQMTGKNYVERVVIKAIKNDIAIYAIHTNLDNVLKGVSGRMAAMLGLRNIKVLEEKKSMLSKLVVYCPLSHLETIRSAMFKAGAGSIGNYDECSFSVEGEGTFRANNDAKPFFGEIGKQSREIESKLEVVVAEWQQSQAVAAMLEAHPYEEVAYDLIALKNSYQEIGSGIVGEFETPLQTVDFLEKIKTVFQCRVVRHTTGSGKSIQRVALCGGSGSFLIEKALQIGADAYISADIKYHQFFDAENRILLADIGHYESEQYTIDLLSEWLAEKFPNFAIHKTGVETNPIHYFL